MSRFLDVSTIEDDEAQDRAFEPPESGLTATGGCVGCHHVNLSTVDLEPGEEPLLVCPVCIERARTQRGIDTTGMTQGALMRAIYEDEIASRKSFREAFPDERFRFNRAWNNMTWGETYEENEIEKRFAAVELSK